jgi:hypothetical protein
MPGYRVSLESKNCFIKNSTVFVEFNFKNNLAIFIRSSARVSLEDVPPKVFQEGENITIFLSPSPTVLVH